MPSALATVSLLQLSVMKNIGTMREKSFPEIPYYHQTQNIQNSPYVNLQDCFLSSFISGIIPRMSYTVSIFLESL